MQETEKVTEAATSALAGKAAETGKATEAATSALAGKAAETGKATEAAAAAETEKTEGTEKSAEAGKAAKTAGAVKTLDLVYIAIGAVLIAVCSWISIPMAVPFTMQTFAVFAVCALLGGRRGTVSVLVYILLGLVGLPVFSGFGSGAGVLFGLTGGYIIGFIFAALVIWASERLFGTKLLPTAVSMFVGLAVCYTIGTAWFIHVYSRTRDAIGISAVLGMCVIPFIIPDALKITLALILSRRLRPFIGLQH